MKRNTIIVALSAVATSMMIVTTGCDMMLDSVEPSADYNIGVGTGGVNLSVGTSLWSPGWNSPFWTYPVYRPAYVAPPRPIVNPIPPTAPGGGFRPAPTPPPSAPIAPNRPPQNNNNRPTPPASGQRPGAH